MIRSFRCSQTQQLFYRLHPKRFVSIEAVARRKLRQLHASEQLMDLAAPPGNQLEALKGKRQGQYSIRVNDQWQICFTWKDKDAYDVEIVDYH